MAKLKAELSSPISGQLKRKQDDKTQQKQSDPLLGAWDVLDDYGDSSIEGWMERRVSGELRRNPRKAKPFAKYQWKSKRVCSEVSRSTRLLQANKQNNVNNHVVIDNSITQVKSNNTTVLNVSTNNQDVMIEASVCAIGQPPATQSDVHTSGANHSNTRTHGKIDGPQMYQQSVTDKHSTKHGEESERLSNSTNSDNNTNREVKSQGLITSLVHIQHNMAYSCQNNVTDYLTSSDGSLKSDRSDIFTNSCSRSCDGATDSVASMQKSFAVMPEPTKIKFSYTQRGNSKSHSYPSIANAVNKVSSSLPNRSTIFVTALPHYRTSCDDLRVESAKLECSSRPSTKDSLNNPLNGCVKRNCIILDPLEGRNPDQITMDIKHEQPNVELPPTLQKYFTTHLSPTTINMFSKLKNTHVHHRSTNGLNKDGPSIAFFPIVDMLPTVGRLKSPRLIRRINHLRHTAGVHPGLNGLVSLTGKDLLLHDDTQDDLYLSARRMGALTDGRKQGVCHPVFKQPQNFNLKSRDLLQGSRIAQVNFSYESHGLYDKLRKATDGIRDTKPDMKDANRANQNSAPVGYNKLYRPVDPDTRAAYDELRGTLGKNVGNQYRSPISASLKDS